MVLSKDFCFLLIRFQDVSLPSWIQETEAAFSRAPSPGCVPVASLMAGMRSWDGDILRGQLLLNSMDLNVTHRLIQ